MALQQKMIGTGINPFTAINIAGDTASALTAAGSTQGTALQLGAATNAFTTVAASTGALLPIAGIGDEVKVWNAGANTLSVYGQTGEAIGAGAANAAFSVAANKGASFTKVTGTLWIPILSA